MCVDDFAHLKIEILFCDSPQAPPSMGQARLSPSSSISPSVIMRFSNRFKVGTMQCAMPPYARLVGLNDDRMISG